MNQENRLQVPNFIITKAVVAGERKPDRTDIAYVLVFNSKDWEEATLTGVMDKLKN